jgi:8-oxo-dGTP diphosphatase
MQLATEKRPSLRKFGTKLAGLVYIERPGVYAVIENNHKQIAVIKTNTGYFLPGGGIDFGESEMDALKREIFEEIGCQVSVLAEIGEAVEYIKAHTEEKYYQIHSKFYQVQIVSKTGEGTEKDHRLVWLSRGDAPRLLLRQSQAWAVQQIAKE